MTTYRIQCPTCEGKCLTSTGTRIRSINRNRSNSFVCPDCRGAGAIEVEAAKPPAGYTILNKWGDKCDKRA